MLVIHTPNENKIKKYDIIRNNTKINWTGVKSWKVVI